MIHVIQCYPFIDSGDISKDIVNSYLIDVQVSMPNICAGHLNSVRIMHKHTSLKFHFGLIYANKHRKVRMHLYEFIFMT